MKKVEILKRLNGIRKASVNPGYDSYSPENPLLSSLSTSHISKES